MFGDELAEPLVGAVVGRLEHGDTPDPAELRRLRSLVLVPEHGRRLLVRPLVDPDERVALDLLIPTAAPAGGESTFTPLPYEVPADPRLARLELRLVFARGVAYERYWLAVQALREERTASGAGPVTEADRLAVAAQTLRDGGTSMIAWGRVRDRYAALVRRRLVPGRPGGGN